MHTANILSAVVKFYLPGYQTRSFSPRVTLCCYLFIYPSSISTSLHLSIYQVIYIYLSISLYLPVFLLRPRLFSSSCGDSLLQFCLFSSYPLVCVCVCLCVDDFTSRPWCWRHRCGGCVGSEARAFSLSSLSSPSHTLSIYLSIYVYHIYIHLLTAFLSICLPISLALVIFLCAY